VLIYGALPPPVNGQTVMLKILVDSLVDRGVRFDLVNLSTSENKRQGSFSPTRALGVLRCLTAALRYLPRSGVVYVPIAQSIWGTVRDLPLIAGARLLRKRIILHLHGGNYAHFYATRGRMGRRILRAYLRSAASVLVLAEELRDQFAFDESVRHRTRVVANTVEQFPTASGGGGGERIRVLYLSNLTREKGYFSLLEAVDHLAARGLADRCEFVFAGRFQLSETEALPSIEAMEREFDGFVAGRTLGARVRRLGVVEGEAKERLLASSDLLILPSRFIEGQPLVVIEALAHGLWVLSTRNGGLGSMFTDGRHGRYLETATPEAVAKGLEDYFEKDYMLHDRNANSAWARARFSRDRHVDSVLAALRG